MKTRSSSPSLILSRAFEQVPEVSSFARRTRESYTEELVSLFAQVGHMPVTALTTDVIQSFLARQESLAPATCNRHLAALRSFTCWLRDQGWLEEALLDRVKRKPEGNERTEPLYQWAIAIYKQTFGPHHPGTKTIQEKYTLFLEEKKQNRR